LSKRSMPKEVPQESLPTSPTGCSRSLSRRPSRGSGLNAGGTLPNGPSFIAGGRGREGHLNPALGDTTRPQRAPPQPKKAYSRSHGCQARRWSVKKLVSLSWRARGSGATCTAEVDHPIRGYKVNPKYRSSPPALSGPEGQAPTVSWISFDGDIYWVRLAAANGWPRSIRITQADVDGARG
jgi:hypothetical protein